MFYLHDGDIVPHERIGILKLGMNYKEVRALVGECEEEERARCVVFNCGDVRIWVDTPSNKVFQILVFGNFQSKYVGKIGIGSTLKDVEEMLGVGWEEDLDAYELKGVRGMCFELGDSGDETYWDEMSAPIEEIAVYLEDDEL